jgi:hypothetical protein
MAQRRLKARTPRRNLDHVIAVGMPNITIGTRTVKILAARVGTTA